tara:strand:- start:189 stop:476 length:288 start_codon:yes stop_codon:yes gene_type:complete
MDTKYEFSNGYIIETYKPNEARWKFLISLYPNDDLVMGVCGAMEIPHTIMTDSTENLFDLRKEVISRLPPNQNYIVATPFHIVVGDKKDASNLSH